MHLARFESMRSHSSMLPSLVQVCRSVVLTAVFGVATLAPRVAAAKECRTDAECGADFTCAKPCGTPGCSTPPNCPTPVVTCAESGTCEPKYHACAVVGDCPAGLLCGSDPGGACWRSSTGETNCTEGAKVCTFEQATCSSDDQCGAGFVCASVGAIGCGTSFIPDAGPCNGVEIKACVPRRTPCDVAADCGPGALCFNFAESRAGMPASWGATAVKACVSEGLAFALQGHAYLKGPGFSGGGSSQTTGDGDPGFGNEGPSGEADGAATKTGGGACSMVGAGSVPPLSMAALLGVALAFARTRRRR